MATKLNFVQLTTTYGTPIWVNVDMVAKLAPHGTGSIIYFSGDPGTIVLEPPDYIMPLASPRDDTNE